MKPELLIICGPTASGKTSLSIQCAKILETEIISADSMNVYKELNIGTAKPTVKEMEGIKHHLINVVEPNNNFTVGEYRNLALPIIDDLLSKGKTPIICGGTGFYINSLIYDYSYGNSEANLEKREYYFNLAEKFGNEYVYNILKEVDPESAKILHFNDLKRVVRALEIYHSGIKKSQLNNGNTPIHSYKAFSFLFPREELYNRIDLRVDEMINNGLIDEVDGLRKNGISIKNQCMQGIGYKEIYSYLEGELSLDESVDLIKLNTHHYAKRQITFFKKLKNIDYLSYNKDLSTIAKSIVKDFQ